MAAETILLEGGGVLELDEVWLARIEADALFHALRSELAWAERTIRIAGRELLQPRLVAWYGDPHARYTYSGKTNEPLPWTPTLARLRDRVRAHTGCSFDSVLANLYRNERDSMGRHADAEKALGPNPVIASVSLGAPRRFVLTFAEKGRRVPKVELVLGPGSLLVMRGTTQHHWKHEVPKEKTPVGPRINLTFRVLVG